MLVDINNNCNDLLTVHFTMDYQYSNGREHTWLFLTLLTYVRMNDMIYMTYVRKDTVCQRLQNAEEYQDFPVNSDSIHQMKWRPIP